jgi:hypothetical protein
MQQLHDAENRCRSFSGETTLIRSGRKRNCIHVHKKCLQLRRGYESTPSFHSMTSYCRQDYLHRVQLRCPRRQPTFVARLPVSVFSPNNHAPRVILCFVSQVILSFVRKETKCSVIVSFVYFDYLRCIYKIGLIYIHLETLCKSRMYSRKCKECATVSFAVLPFS